MQECGRLSESETTDAGFGAWFGGCLGKTLHVHRIEASRHVIGYVACREAGSSAWGIQCDLAGRFRAAVPEAPLDLESV